MFYFDLLCSNPSLTVLSDFLKLRYFGGFNNLIKLLQDLLLIENGQSAFQNRL
jgi:hypothetical protein